MHGSPPKRSAVNPPVPGPSRWIVCRSGVAGWIDSAWGAGTPSGAGVCLGKRSGGVAMLMPRLIYVTPLGSGAIEVRIRYPSVGASCAEA